MMHETYLPFSEQQLISHFSGKQTEQLNYYKKSIERYNNYLAYSPARTGQPITDVRLPCQIENDERFWIASSMMTIFYSQNRVQEFSQLFKRCYGETPPVNAMSSWEECFEGELCLFFEPNLPSPRSYKDWLYQNLKHRQLIPYVLDSAVGKKNLEGATNVDAMVINPGNGFAALIEAKVLSDISHDITYDTMRNQMARNIDVMLESNDGLSDPLNKRDPEKTVFLIVTPKLFKDNPTSRLYGYKFNAYTTEPEVMADDLPHRQNLNWQNISRRLGWLTWEDFKNVNQNCCKWLDKGNP